MNAIYHVLEDKATIFAYKHPFKKNPMNHCTLIILLLTLGIGPLASSCEKKETDIDLTSWDWKVEKIRKRGNLIYTRTDSTYILEFTSDEAYRLDLDVNTCIGLYEIVQNGSIELQAMACTKVCCDSEFAQDLSGLVPQMTSYYIRDNKLHFEGEGEIILQAYN